MAHDMLSFFFPWIIFKLVVKFGIYDIFEEILVTCFKEIIVHITSFQGVLLPNFWLQIMNFYNLGFQEKNSEPKATEVSIYHNDLEL